MTDFSNLTKESTDSTTYTFNDIESRPKLHVRQATERNRPYFTQLLKQVGRRRQSVSAQAVQKNRNMDYDLYPKYIVSGWEDVVDAHGNNVDFSEEACKAFLRAIPDYMFDDLRAFCQEPGSFEEDGEATTIDEEGLGN